MPEAPSIMDAIRFALESQGFPPDTKLSLDGVELENSLSIWFSRSDGVIEAVVDDRPIAHVQVSALLPPRAEAIEITITRGPLVDLLGEGDHAA